MENIFETNKKEKTKQKKKSPLCSQILQGTFDTVFARQEFMENFSKIGIMALDENVSHVSIPTFLKEMGECQ